MKNSREATSALQQRQLEVLKHLKDLHNFLPAWIFMDYQGFGHMHEDEWVKMQEGVFVHTDRVALYKMILKSLG